MISIPEIASDQLVNKWTQAMVDDIDNLLTSSKESQESLDAFCDEVMNTKFPLIEVCPSMDDDTVMLISPAPRSNMETTNAYITRLVSQDRVAMVRGQA